MQVDQLSVVIRWVEEGGSIHETFLGFVAITSGKAEALTELVIELLQSYGLDFSKMRGQVTGSSVQYVF